LNCQKSPVSRGVLWDPAAPRDRAVCDNSVQPVVA
jgi:hypothetical protein